MTDASISGRGDSGAGEEFARGWPVLLGAIVGVGAGAISLPFAAISLFMRDLVAHQGWTRAEISLASTILLGVLALSAPVVGRLADRISEARLAAGSIAALAVGFFALSRLPAGLPVFYAMFAVMGLLGAGAATVTFARVVSRSFVRARGLALGLSMVGTGLSSAVLPVVLAPYVAAHGWRAGFVVLAAIAAVAAPLVLVLLRAAPRAEVAASGEAPEAFSVDRTYWVLAAVFGLVALAGVGMNLHFVAFLTDAGLSPVKAGALAGSVGLAILGGRLLTGWLMDRLFAPRVAAAMMLVSAAGLAALALAGAPAALAGVLALGLCLGAEIDLIGYLTARYYGLKAYGRVYGGFYTVCLIGTAASPLVYGALHDLSGGYQGAQLAGAAALLVSAALLLTLPGFPEEA